MSTQPIKLYNVISTGTLKSGISEEMASSNLCKKLNIQANIANRLLQTGTLIKQGVDKASALKYQAQLEHLGLVVRFVLMPSKQDKRNHVDYNQAYFEQLLDKPFKKIKTSLGYKLGLICVLTLSLIAPLLYLSFILFIIYSAIQYTAYYSNEILGSSYIKTQIFMGIVPYFILSILLIFLLRPLFVSYKKPYYYVLKRKQFPGLFHLVEVMCNKIGVPVPKEITVDNEVNAHAGPINGLTDLVKGNLRLNVGLPLLAGMKINQFVGVLAHEFGHFAQPTAMFANIVINRVNHWLADRAYNLDPLQQRLETWKEENEDNFFMSYAVFGIILLNACIFSIRLLFKGLFHTNYFLTRFMSRKMEHDADCYESAFAGSEEFSKTSIQLRKLSYGAFETQKLNTTAWNDNQLLNDYSQAIAHVTSLFPDSIDKQIEQDMTSMKFDAWATHPADNDRIDYISKRNDTPIITADFPATTICPMFETLSKEITANMYFKSFGNDLFKPSLRDNKDILMADQKKQEQNKSIDIYYNNSYTHRLIELELSQDAHITDLNLEQCITKIRSESLNFQTLQKQISKSIDKLHYQKLGLSYCQVNIEINASSFYLNSNNEHEIQTQIKHTFNEINSNLEKRALKDKLFRQRIELDLALMPIEQQKSIRENLHTLNQISKFRKDFLELDINTRLLRDYHKEDEETFECVREHAEHCQNRMYDLSMSIINAGEAIRLCNNEQPNLKALLLTWAKSVALTREEMSAQRATHLAEQVTSAIRHYFFWTYSHIIDQCLTVELEHDVKQLKLF